MTYKKTFNKLKKNKEKALVSFIVAGDPNYKTSLDIVKTIIDAGTDILEIGQGFSDPIADGSTIQAADVRALKSGMNTDNFFNFIKQIRKYNDKIPIGLLIYSNLIYQYGINNYYKKCKQAGVDSVLIADVPIEESDLFIKSARKNKIDTVFLITQLTDTKRIKSITKKTRGFVYIVSRLGVTGARKDLSKATIPLIKKLRKQTKLPLCVGFGVSKPEHVKDVCKAGADGAIVGSAIVKIIEQNLNNKKLMLNKISNFVKKLKQATK